MLERYFSDFEQGFFQLILEIQSTPAGTRILIDVNNVHFDVD